jgi:LPXTG-motif cell wall-anchored protein
MLFQISPFSFFLANKAFAETGFRHQVLGGQEVVLGGNYIEVGISKSGSFGTENPAPSGFHPSNGGVGLRVDGDGFDTGNPPTTGDFFLPGTPEESFTIGYKVGSDAVNPTKYTNAERNNQEDITTVTTDTTSSNILSALTSGTTSDNNLAIQQRISFEVNNKFFKNTVTYTNKGTSILYDVRYMRSFDPDQDSDFNNTSNTKNQVIENFVGTEKRAIVKAAGSTTGDTVFFISMDNRARVANPGLGLVNRDPYDLRLYNTDGSTLKLGEKDEDSAIAITFSLGNLAPGQSTTFEYYTSLDPDYNSGLEDIMSSLGIQINNGAKTTNSLDVELNLSGQNVEEMRFSNDNATWSSWETYASTKAWTLTAGDGTKTVYAQFKSSSGNTSTVNASIEYTKPDITPPTFSVSGNPSDWTKENVTLTVDARDTESGLASAAYSFDGGNSWQSANTKIYNENTSSIVVKVKDKAGNIETYDTINITKIDKTAPNPAVIANKNNYTATKWYNENQTITASFITTPGCGEKLQYKVDDSTWADGESVAINTEGKYDVGFRVIDDLGRTSEVQTVKVNLDKTAPQTAVINDASSYTDSRWYNENQTITASFITTPGCGEKLQYKVGAEAWADGESVAINAEGKYDVGFRVIDDLGRASEVQTVKVNLDKTAPTNARITVKDRGFTSFLNAVTFNLFFKETVNVSITADSNIAGVNKIEYQKVSKETDYDPNGPWTSGNSFNVTPEEKFIVYAKVTDNAGNYVIINTEGVIVDATTPALTLTPDANDWTKNNVNVKVIVSDNLAGLKEVSYTTNEAIPQSGTITITAGEGDIPLTNEGQYKLTVTAVDNSLNEIVQIADIKLDKTLPVITSVTGNPSDWIKDSVTLTVDARDTESGLANAAYSFDGGNSWQSADTKIYNENTNSIVVKVKDKAGNIETYETINITKIDKTAPNPAVIANKDNYTDSNWYNENQTITASFTATPGCGEKLQHKVGDSAWTDGESVAINTEGKYDVSFRVIDDLGRTSEVQTVKVNLDKTKPVITGATEFLSYFIGRVINLRDDVGEIAEATYQKGTDSESTFKNGDFFEKAGKYSLKLRDKAGNWSTLYFEIMALPKVEDVVYTSDYKALIDSIRAEFITHKDLSEPYKTDMDVEIKALEDRYSQLDKEVMKIKTDTSIIKGKVDALSNGVDGLFNLQKEIQDEYNKIAGDTSTLTGEQKLVLEKEAEYLKQQLNIIATLQNQVNAIKIQVSNIDTKEDGLISQEAKIIGALSDIGKLTKEQQSILKPEIDLLNSLHNKINTLKEQVKTVKEMISSLPALDKITIKDSGNITKINEIIIKLTNEQKELLGSDLIKIFNDATAVLRKLMLHDDNTDTTVTGIDGTSFTTDVYLVVTPIDEHSNEEKFDRVSANVENASKTISELKEKELLVLYDVSLFRDNIKIQPDGKVKVKIKIPESLRNRTGFDIIHIADDGKVTTMNAAVEGEYLVFITDHFSDYAIVAKSITREIPKTGSTIDLTTLMLAGGILTIIGIGALRRKRKEKYNN